MSGARPVDGPAEEPEDAVLIARWQSGDQTAATALVGRHAPAVGRFVVSLGVRSDVEEIVQDTFVKAFGALDGFRADSALRTWLFTIARRLVLDRRRAARRAKDVVDVQDGDAVLPYDALDDLVATETGQRVAEALERLTPLQRGVFLLRVQEGRSYRDIAGILDTTEGSARVHYHNALRAVKEWLDD